MIIDYRLHTTTVRTAPSIQGWSCDEGARLQQSGGENSLKHGVLLNCQSARPSPATTTLHHPVIKHRLKKTNSPVWCFSHRPARPCVTWCYLRFPPTVFFITPSLLSVALAQLLVLIVCCPKCVGRTQEE